MIKVRMSRLYTKIFKQIVESAHGWHGSAMTHDMSGEMMEMSGMLRNDMPAAPAKK